MKVSPLGQRKCTAECKSVPFFQSNHVQCVPFYLGNYLPGLMFPALSPLIQVKRMDRVNISNPRESHTSICKYIDTRTNDKTRKCFSSLWVVMPRDISCFDDHRLHAALIIIVYRNCF